MSDFVPILASPNQNVDCHGKLICVCKVDAAQETGRQRGVQINDEA
jgi:hypothetical protein